MYTIKCKLKRKIPICGLKKRWPDIIGEVAKAKYSNRVINAGDYDDYDELIMQN